MVTWYLIFRCMIISTLCEVGPGELAIPVENAETYEQCLRVGMLAIELMEKENRPAHLLEFKCEKRETI